MDVLSDNEQTQGAADRLNLEAAQEWVIMDHNDNLKCPDCHGLFPNSPCPSEASPLPLTARPVSKPFRSTSNPPGSLAYFLFSLTESRIFPIPFLYLIL